MASTKHLLQTLLAAGSYEEHLEVVQQAHTSGQLHAVVSILSSICTDQPDQDVCTAFAVCKAVSDSSAGRQALVASGCCPAVAQLILQLLSKQQKADDVFSVPSLSYSGCSSSRNSSDISTASMGTDDAESNELSAEVQESGPSVSMASRSVQKPSTLLVDSIQLLADLLCKAPAPAIGCLAWHSGYHGNKTARNISTGSLQPRDDNWGQLCEKLQDALHSCIWSILTRSEEISKAENCTDSQLARYRKRTIPAVDEQPAAKKQHSEEETTTCQAESSCPKAAAPHLLKHEPLLTATDKLRNLMALLHVRLSLDLQHRQGISSSMPHSQTMANINNVNDSSSAQAPTFDQLLLPLDISTFKSVYWEQQPLHISGGSNMATRRSFFRCLFPKGSLTHLLSKSFHLPSIEAHTSQAVEALQQWTAENMLNVTTPLQAGQDARLVRVTSAKCDSTECVSQSRDISNQQSLKTTQEWALQNSCDGITLEDAKQAFSQGYTLAIRGVGSRLPSVNVLQDSMCKLLGASPGVNAYLTPPGAQGLSEHYDDHCVWVMQLYGSKRWLVRAPADAEQTLPMTYQPGDHEVEPLCCDDVLVKQYLLQPGDVLYIPRGWAHQADTKVDVTQWVNNPGREAAASHYATSLPQHQKVVAKQHQGFDRDENKLGGGDGCTEDEWWQVPGASLHLTLGAEVEPCLTWQAPIHWAIETATEHLLNTLAADGGISLGIHAKHSDVISVHAAGLLLHAVICQASVSNVELRQLCPLAGTTPKNASTEAQTTLNGNSLRCRQLLAMFLEGIGFEFPNSHKDKAAIGDISSSERSFLSTLTSCMSVIQACCSPVDDIAGLLPVVTATAGHVGSSSEAQKDIEQNLIRSAHGSLPTYDKPAPIAVWLLGYWLDRVPCMSDIDEPEPPNMQKAQTTDKDMHTSTDVTSYDTAIGGKFTCCLECLVNAFNKLNTAKHLLQHVNALIKVLLPVDKEKVGQEVQDSNDITDDACRRCWETAWEKASNHASRLLDARAAIARALCELHPALPITQHTCGHKVLSGRLRLDLNRTDDVVVWLKG